MNHCLKWCLEATDKEMYKITHDQFLSTDVTCFFTLADAWSHIGKRLKKSHYGYIGESATHYYWLRPIN